MVSRYNFITSKSWNMNSIVTQKNKIILLLGLLLGFAQLSYGQSYLINPAGDGGFESGTTFAANGWTTVNTTNNALWQIGTAAAGYTGSRGAFVGPNATTYTYTNSTSRTSHFYRNITVPSGA